MPVEATDKDGVQRESRWLSWAPRTEAGQEGLCGDRDCRGGGVRAEGPVLEDEVLSRGRCSLAFSKGTRRASAQAQRGKRLLGLRKWLQLFGRVFTYWEEGEMILKTEMFTEEDNYHCAILTFQ